MTIKLAENLQLLRKEKGITQEELANVFNVTSQSVSKWELGLSCPDISVLPEIAEYYKVSIDELLGYKPMTSINSVYIQIKSFFQTIKDDGEYMDAVFRISRLCASMEGFSEKEKVSIESLIQGKHGTNCSINQKYGKEFGGVISHDFNSMLISSFKDLDSLKPNKIREIYKTLSKYANINVLKVMIALFESFNIDQEKYALTIEEISDITGLSEEKVNEAINNVDAKFDIIDDEERWYLTHRDTVPLLMLLNQGDVFFKDIN